MSDKTELHLGFQRGVKMAITLIEQKQRCLTAEIDFLNYKLGHGHNMTNYERQCEQEKRHALTVAMRELTEILDYLNPAMTIGE